MKRRNFFKLLSVSPVLVHVKSDTEQRQVQNYVNGLRSKGFPVKRMTIRDIIDPQVMASMILWKYK